MTIQLPLRYSEGETVLVDDAVATFLQPYLRRGWRLRRWYDGEGRPTIFQPQQNGIQPPPIRLARWIMRAAPDQFPQHHNGDVLDCRRSNLYLDVSRGQAWFLRNTVP